MLFVPESERSTFQALEDSKGCHILKEWCFTMAFLKVIVGNFWTEMVNVMKADITGEPLNDPRQTVVGASLEG